MLRIARLSRFGLNAASVRPQSLSRSRPLGLRLLTTHQYNLLADEALDTITESYEDLIEERPEVDVDLAQGVLTIVAPPTGTYVINKQPPNKQIWLSSPISGPKRYNFEDGKWLCERDSSSLGDLLKNEVRQMYETDLKLDLD